MKNSLILSMMNNIGFILFFLVTFSVILYFFGDKLTLDDKEESNKQHKQKYTYFFKQDIVFSNINIIIFMAIMIILFIIKLGK
jgi:hypothetical protein